jgi:hypothetical protein
MPPDAIAAPDQETGGYASMILFRKDLGPPPGLLLMNRRRTLGTGCRNAIHKTFFNRVFVPVAAAPERQRCFNLAGEFQIEGSAPRSFRFTSSDRMVLLAPSDLSERYRGVRHSFTTTLYDRLDCAGETVSFRSGSLAPGSTKLDDFGFRDRARSVRIAYQSGPLSAYMTPAAAPTTASMAKSPEPVPQPASEPEPAPATASEPAPRPAPEPEPGLEVVATAPEPEPAPKPAAEPAPATGSQRPLPEIKWDPPAEPAPAQAATVAPAVAPAVPPAAPSAAPVAESSPAPAAASQAQPKLEPVLLPETQAMAGLASQAFAYPVHQVYRLNFCLTSKGDCGEPAAQAWCKTQGFGTASAWKIDENIGSLFPTVMLGDNRICAQFVCDGFQEITCAN